MASDVRVATPSVLQPSTAGVVAGDTEDPIPFALPDVGDDEADAVASVIKRGWVTSGPSMRAFETEFSTSIGQPVASVAVNSATAGLHLALEALGVGAGDEVIVPAWTFTATAEVVRYQGATPVIVDVDPATLNIDPQAVERAITPRTRAVIPVHFAGLPADVHSLWQLTRDRGIHIVEDAAHAIPASSLHERIGSCRFSDVAVFSFYATKTLTTGEGGMITSRSDAVLERCRVMRLHGIDRDAFDRYSDAGASWRYDVVAPGFKYNLSDPAAEMGRVQLRRSPAMWQRRSDIANFYSEAFAQLPLRLPEAGPAGAQHAWHLYVLRLEEPGLRDDFINHMRGAGIATSVHFIPLHELTYWKPFVTDPGGELPVTTSQSQVAVSIPMFSRMSDAQVERVADTVAAWCRGDRSGVL